MSDQRRNINNKVKQLKRVIIDLSQDEELVNKIEPEKEIEPFAIADEFVHEPTVNFEDVTFHKMTTSSNKSS